MRIVSAVLLLAGAVCFPVALALRWSSVASTHGGVAIASRGVDYAGYDVATTIALGVLLAACAAAVLPGARWAGVTAVVCGVLAGFWAALVFMAAQYPASGASSADLRVEVGPGAYLLAAGAAGALVGAALSFVRRRPTARSASTSEAPSAV